MSRFTVRRASRVGRYPILVFAVFLAFLTDQVAAQTAATPPPAPTPVPPPSNATRTVFTSGDLMMRNPVEGSVVFVLAVLFAAGVERVLERLMRVKSQYFQLVFKSFAQETLVVGVMTLIIIFIVALGIVTDRIGVLLKYAVMSLLMMVAFFIFLSGITVVVLRIGGRGWHDFETTRIDADAHLSSCEELYKQCRDHFRASVEARGLVLPAECLFADYLQRQEGPTMACMCDLTWKPWIGLSLLIAINGVRSRISLGGALSSSATLSRQDRVSNVGSYIGFIGYGALALFGALYWQLQRRLAAFAEAPLRRREADAASGGGAWKNGDADAAGEDKFAALDTSSRYLFFGSTGATCSIFQTVILFMEWYFAVFVLGMAREAWDAFGPVALALYIAAALPVAIVMWLLPWAVTSVAFLRSLGRDLDTAAVEALALDAGMALGRGGHSPHRSGAVAPASSGNADGDRREGATAVLAFRSDPADEGADEWDGPGLVSLHASLVPGSATAATTPGAQGRDGRGSRSGASEVATDARSDRGAQLSSPAAAAEALRHRAPPTLRPGFSTRPARSVLAMVDSQLPPLVVSSSLTSPDHNVPPASRWMPVHALTPFRNQNGRRSPEL